MSVRKPGQKTNAEIDSLRWMRWKARTDLGWLCRNVLGYKDVHDEYHGPVLKTLQKFPLPTRDQFAENDKFVQEKGGYRWQYKPIRPITQLDAGRRRLILESRGHLKTTINIQAHTIQWLINYPNTAILLVQSNLDKVTALIKEIKHHFLFNDKFRELFPEHCPNKTKDWGTQLAFTTEARERHISRREESVMGASIEKGLAGYHFDIIKFTDIVDEQNSRSVDSNHLVIHNFFMMENLLNSPPSAYWLDVEGTRYHMSDLYGRLIDNWLDEKRTGAPHHYIMSTRGCFLKDVDNPQNTPDELMLPDKVVDGKKIPVWPQLYNEDGDEKGFTFEYFEAARRRDPVIFACQNLNNPMAEESGRIVFRVDSNLPKMIKREIFTQRIPIAYREISVDTAYTVSDRADYTAITVAAWSKDGKVYIEEILHGKYSADKIQKLIIETYNKYHTPLRPVRAVKIEQTGFTLGWTELKRYMDRTGQYLPLEMLKRDSNTSKQERIESSLQPWYVNGHIIFLDDLAAWPALKKELMGFPKYEHDDILDTLADLFQNKQWYGRETPRQATPQEMLTAGQKHFIEIAKLGDPFDEEYSFEPTVAPGCRTGLL
jgi:predicted phage terminase large subunit-like protein